MKKLITLSCVLFFGVGIAVGQNTTTITQNGSNADLDITQSGSNEAVVEQTSDGQSISAVINQTGSNSVNITQDHNRSFPLLNGGNMNITVNQHATESEATINQGPAGFTGFFPNPIGDLSATISQNGDSHVATQTQTGVDNEAVITQSGSSNEATQTQAGLNGFNVATVTQSGGNNYAMQDQDGFISGVNTATATQSGDYNWISQDQNTLGGHVSEATQSGTGTAIDMNRIEQLQFGLSQESIATQMGGEGNAAFTQQYGSEHYSYISQDGAFNQVTTTQRNSGDIPGPIQTNQ